MAKAAARRQGRPPQGPKSGKGATLATRITAETRERIRAEVERTGRSMSQVVEVWLDEASKGQAGFLQRFGNDPEIAAAVEKIAEIVRAIRASEGDAELAGVALRAAWQSALPRLIRPPAGLESRAFSAAWANHQAWVACGQVLEALKTAPADDPVAVRASEPLKTPSKGILAGLLDPEPAHLIELLIPPSKIIPRDAGQNALRALSAPDFTPDPPSDLTLRALDALSEAGPTAGVELARARHRVQASLDQQASHAAQYARAAELGRRMADALLGGEK